MRRNTRHDHSPYEKSPDFPEEGDELAATRQFETVGDLAAYLSGFGPGTPITCRKGMPNDVLVRIIQLGGRPVISIE